MGKIYLFNPDNDMALANGDANYLPPRSARRMAMDLAFLPVWYANDGDAVLIPNSDVIYYWSKTLRGGIYHPEIKWITDKEILSSQTLSPWGWNPALVKQMKLRGMLDNDLPNASLMASLRLLSGRQTAVEVLNQTKRILGDKCPLIGEANICLTEDEIARIMDEYLSVILKAPWSCSGKGLRRGQGIYAPPLSGWCARILAQQGAVIVEPLYDKVKDFAMEFYASGDGSPLSFVGYSSFVTDANGAYEGNLLIADEDIENELSEYISHETLYSVRECLQHLISECVGTVYSGYIGVDMMICHASKASQECGYFLHPCVEINLRMNMGVVAHILYERYVALGCQGRFMVEYYSTPEELKKIHLQRIADYPLELSADGRIIKGYQPLTPVGRETQYIAWMMVS